MHPLFQLLGLREVISQTTVREEKLLRKRAHGRKVLVELGVAEGASAFALRSAADPSGIIYLVDPYLPGRIPGLNVMKLVAHRYVNSCSNARVVWIEKFSYDAAQNWHGDIEFLFIDAGHSCDNCMRDWKDWSGFVVKGGNIAFHDGRLFEGGWTTPDTGSVRIVNQLFRSQSNPKWKIIDEVDSLVVVERI